MTTFTRFIQAIARRQQSQTRIGPIARKASGYISLPVDKTYRDVLTEALTEKYGIKERNQCKHKSET